MHRNLPVLFVLWGCLLAVAGCDGDRAQDALGEEEGPESCASCHEKLEPGLMAQLAASPHAKVPVTCEQCHGEDHDAIFAAGGAVPPSVCAACHQEAWEEFQRGRHGRHLKEAEPNPVLHEFSLSVGGCSLTTGCHSIQKEYPDGGVGRCNGCHPAHEFSNREARNPRICHTCHTGGDNPEYEVWLQSAHSFSAPGSDRPVADCVECHGTHDVSSGLTHGLSPVSPETPPLFVKTLSLEEFRKARAAMLDRCRRCHGTRFARAALRKADLWRRRGAQLVAEAERIVRGLAKDGLLEPAPGARMVNPVHGTRLRLGGAQIYDLTMSLPERIYYDMRYHLYPVLWRGAYHTDPERHVWEWNDALKSSLDRLRAVARDLREKAVRKGGKR